MPYGPSSSSSSSGSASFGTLAGVPGDNAALVAALAAKLDKAGGTITGNGAASTPALTLNGSVFTGGSSTTTKPQLLVEPSGATSNNWSTSGSLLGLNAPNAFAGNLLDAQVNGSARFRVSSGGAIFGGSTAIGTGTLLSLTSLYGTVTASMVGSMDVLWSKGFIVPGTGIVRWGYVGANDPILTGGTGTLTLSQATLVTPASSTTRAGLRVPSGSAPTSPVQGDLWFNGTNLMFFDGTTTQTLAW